MYKTKKFDVTEVEEAKYTLFSELKRIFDENGGCAITIVTSSSTLFCNIGVSADMRTFKNNENIAYEDCVNISLDVNSEASSKKIQNEIREVISSNKNIEDIGVTIFEGDRRSLNILIYKISKLTRIKISEAAALLIISCFIKKENCDMNIRSIVSNNHFNRMRLDEISSILKKNNRYDLLIENLL